MKKLVIAALALLALTSAAIAATTATAVVGTGVENRVAVGAADRFPATVGSLTCVSEVLGGNGTIKHVWIHGDKEMTTIELPVKADRWRTWSHKRIQPSWTGPWRVEVRAADGTVLAKTDFEIE